MSQPVAPEGSRERLRLPNGVELSLLDFGGTGPLVLAHHATGFCAAVWEPVAEQLRGAVRFVALDARGHGASSKPDGADAYAWRAFADDLQHVAEALCHRLGLERVELGIGHSFGGTVLLTTCASRPPLFARALLLDPVLVPRDRAALPRGRSMAEGARQRQSVFRSRQAAAASWGTRPFFRHWDERAFAAYLREGLRDRDDGQVELACPPEVEAAVFEGSWKTDAEALAERVEIPVTIAWASGGSFSLEYYTHLASLMPGAQVGAVECGHLIPMERPGTVAKIVREVLGL